MILSPQKLIKSLLYMLSSSGLVLIISILVTVSLARLLNPTDLGILMTAEAFIELFRFFFFFGFGNSIFKMASIDTDGFEEGLNKAIGNAFFIKLLMIPLISILVLGSAHLFVKESFLIELIYAYLVIYFLESFAAIFGIARRARGEFKLVSGILILNKFLRLITIIIVLKFIGGIKELVIAFLIEKIIRIVISYFTTKHLIKPKLDFSSMKALVKHSFGYAFVDPLQGIQAKVDSLILNSFLGPVAVAMYSIPSKFEKALRTVMESMSGVFLPNLHGSYEQDRQYFKTIINKANRFIALTGLAAFFGIYYLADFFIIKFFGAKYADSLEIASLFAYITLISIIERPSELVMISSAAHKQRAFYKTFSIILNILLSIVLIKYMGLIGCVYGTIVANSIRLLIKLYISRKLINNFNLIKIVLPACFLVLIVPYYIVLPLYCIYLALIKSIKKDDINYIRDLIKNRKKSKKQLEIEINEEESED
jgi:O-antigen/teichoic acid export membrane protein